MPNEIKVNPAAIKQLGTHEGCLLSEYNILAVNISHAMRALDIMLKEYIVPDKLQDYFVPLSLYRDALVNFVSCFGEGDGRLNVQAVYKDFKGGVEYFNHLKTLKDKFTGDESGALRNAPTNLAVDENGAYMGIVKFTMQFDFPKQEAVVMMLKFIDIARVNINQKIMGYVQKIDGELKAMSKEDIAALGTAEETKPVTEAKAKKASSKKK